MISNTTVPLTQILAYVPELQCTCKCLLSHSNSLFNTQFFSSNLNVHNNFLYSLQVHIRSPFILNGVCVRWKGYLDLERLDGVGAIEFDEETANLEDAVMRDTVEAYNRRIKDFEEHNKARQRQLAAFMGHQQQVCSTVYFLKKNPSKFGTHQLSL